MEDRETPRKHKYGESKTTRITMATVRHVTSSSGLRKFQADGFCSTMSVLADFKSVTLVMLIPLKTFERHFHMYKLITFLYKISNLDNYIQLTADYENFYTR